MSDKQLPNGDGNLKRHLGLAALLVYAVGDILGAGIYTLVGDIAGLAGDRAWLAFAAAMLVAGFTALSYAELSSRYPRAAGAAFFCHQAFGKPWLSLMIGWLVLCSGIVSLATVSLAIAEYVQRSVPAAPTWAVVFSMLVVLGAINFRGIKESSWMNMACTAVEATGLFLVILAGLTFVLGGGPGAAAQAAGPVQVAPEWLGVARGAALAFFAFIGFEDLANVAEEAKEPRRHLPFAIIAAMLITGTLYVVIAWLAVSVVPPHELAKVEGSLEEIVHRAWPAFPGGVFLIIAVFAVSNTGLLNFIMGSRLLYGMSHLGLLPAWLGKVHPRTQTPHWGILTVFVIALTLGLCLSKVTLAGTTSALLLAVFATINLALVVVKLRDEAPPDVFRIPIVAPIVGIIVCLALIGFVPRHSLLALPVFMAAGTVIIAARWKQLAGSSAAIAELDA